MQQTVAIGCDHAGFEMKEYLKKELVKKGYSVKDFGTHSADSMDYPDVVHPLAGFLLGDETMKGILICGSANGVAMTANKHAHIRAALCWKEEIASLARRHNNANIICLPARFVSNEEAALMVAVFLSTDFEGGRHATRVGKMEVPC